MKTVISLSAEDLRFLVKWADDTIPPSHDGEIMGLAYKYPVFQSGEINVANGQNRMLFTVDESNESVYVKLKHMERFLANITISKDEVKIINHTDQLIPSEGEEYLKKLTEQCQALYCMLNAYIILNKEIAISSTKKTRTETGKRGKKTKTTERVVSLRRVEYSNRAIKDDTQEKRAYTKTEDAFEVRGHYRTYKSGKKVWVKPFVKGDKSKLENSKRVYKIK